MKYCPNCKVSVSGMPARCPLCQSGLTGEGTMSSFPPPLQQRTRQFFLRLLIFLSVAGALICVLINTLLPRTGAWSLFVVAGIACLWLSLGVAIRKRRSLLKNITWQAILLSTLAIVWDISTGWRAWSVNFVVPCIFLANMLLTPLLARLMRMPTSAYLVYFCLVFTFGLIPAAFLLTGLVSVWLPSFLSVACSGISLLALCVFGGRTMLDELHRRFHL
ncbi:MAG: DUF6320 domain-containing protein [Intestinibacillus sp.]